jgi:hypothetical protein
MIIDLVIYEDVSITIATNKVVSLLKGMNKSIDKAMIIDLVIYEDVSITIATNKIVSLLKGMNKSINIEELFFDINISKNSIIIPYHHPNHMNHHMQKSMNHHMQKSIYQLQQPKQNLVHIPKYQDDNFRLVSKVI